MVIFTLLILMCTWILLLFHFHSSVNWGEQISIFFSGTEASQGSNLTVGIYSITWSIWFRSSLSSSETTRSQFLRVDSTSAHIWDGCGNSWLCWSTSSLQRKVTSRVSLLYSPLKAFSRHFPKLIGLQVRESAWIRTLISSLLFH